MIFFYMIFLMYIGSSFAADHRLGRYEQMDRQQLHLEILSTHAQFDAKEEVYYAQVDDVCPLATRKNMSSLVGVACGCAAYKLLPFIGGFVSCAVGAGGVALTKVLQHYGEPHELKQERVLTEMRLQVLRAILREKEKQD